MILNAFTKVQLTARTPQPTHLRRGGVLDIYEPDLVSGSQHRLATAI
jgi:hypothetical protein